jgi:hypothetical protein
MAQQWLKRFATDLGPLYAEWAHKDVTAEDLLNYTRIPYIPFWSFGEKLPVIEKGTDNPDDIGYSLETLAALVAQKFSYSDVLVRNRDSFVAAAKKSSATTASGKERGARSSNAIKVFISYSHKDESLRDLLIRHLKPIERQGLIEIWGDRRIVAGESWEDVIFQELNEADIILPLISADYLDSDFIYTIEMRRALQRHSSGDVMIVPVILRPVDWVSSPFEKLQALPRDGKPVITFSNYDEPLAEVAKRVRELANTISLTKGSSRPW